MTKKLFCLFSATQYLKFTPFSFLISLLLLASCIFYTADIIYYSIGPAVPIISEPHVPIFHDDVPTYHVRPNILHVSSKLLRLIIQKSTVAADDIPMAQTHDKIIPVVMNNVSCAKGVLNITIFRIIILITIFRIIIFIIILRIIIL